MGLGAPLLTVRDAVYSRRHYTGGEPDVHPHHKSCPPGGAIPSSGDGAAARYGPSHRSWFPAEAVVSQDGGRLPAPRGAYPGSLLNVVRLRRNGREIWRGLMANRFFVRDRDLRRGIQIGVVGVVCWACSVSQPPPSPSMMSAAVASPEKGEGGAYCSSVDTEYDSVSGKLVGAPGAGPFVSEFIRAIRGNPMLAPPLAASLRR